jgi:PST family polysaccharide transporter
MRKIKNFIHRNKLLFENFSALSILQIAEYIFPLLTLPYLVRVLGPEKFGLVVFAQAFVAYFILLTDYGFNLTATREVSINRENIKKVSEIFLSVYAVKLFLLLISTIIFLSFIFLIPRFNNDYLVFLFAFIMVFGNIMFPVWLFQGMERMRYITIINVIIKGIFIIPIFIFIKDQADYVYVPLISSLSFLFSGIIAFIFSVRIFKIELFLPSFKMIFYQIKEGWYVFISTIAVSLYTTSTVFILGLLTNNTIVGYYSAAERIIRAIRGLLNPISQAVYPHINKTACISKEKAIEFIRKLFKVVGLGSFIVSVAIFFSADFIVKIAFGSQYQESAVVLKFLSFLPFIIGLSNIFGIQTMLAFNFKRAFSFILVLAGLLNLILIFILIPFFQQNGAALSLLITEIFVTASMFYYLKNKGIKFFKESEK